MPYSQFTTLRKVKEAFNLTIVEGHRCCAKSGLIAPSEMLTLYLRESLPFVASASEKARAAGIIYPVLLEVRRILQRQVSFFCGEEFTVEEAVGLSGEVDFLVSRSSQVLEIEAPTLVIVEAKKANLRTSFGSCLATMVAAQKFNDLKKTSITTIYGAVTSGTQWRFLKLEGKEVTIDLTDYPLPPVEQILGLLVWMAHDS